MFNLIKEFMFRSVRNFVIVIVAAIVLYCAVIGGVHYAKLKVISEWEEAKAEFLSSVGIEYTNDNNDNVEI